MKVHPIVPFVPALLVLVAGCDVKAPPVDDGKGQGVEVRVNPATAQVQAGGEVEFEAVVTGSANTSVTWSVVGTDCGAVSPSGLYSAPGTARTCQVRATSVADPTRSGTATVTVTAPPGPITVTVSPANGTVDECRTLTFTAVVSGTSDQRVTWRVQEPTGGTIGASTGLYTAPTDAGTYHVTATSVADPTRSATVPVAVTSRIISVVVNPASASVPVNGTQQFTATVTTTCGAFTMSQSLRPDGTFANDAPSGG